MLHVIIIISYKWQILWKHFYDFDLCPRSASLLQSGTFIYLFIYFDHQRLFDLRLG